MADDRTMAQMLQAPIEGYEDAIVVSPINANNFELKQTLINLVQSNQFTGRQDPHNHLCFFNKGDPQDALKDQGYFDSGCSSHMTGNISYLTDFKEHDGGYVGFGEELKVVRLLAKSQSELWLFDIDALSKSMNYAPVPIGTNFNDFVGKGASFDTGQSSMEIGPSQDYILMPLWKDSSLFDSSSQASDGPNKDKHGPSQTSESDNQEKPNAESSTKIVNTAGPVNIATPTIWEKGNCTWGGRVETMGTIPVCVCAQESWGEGMGCLAGKLGSTLNNDFYHQPFIFKETKGDMRDLVASLFSKQIRDYDMPDGIKVLTNLRAYDDTTDPNDHPMVFIGTIDAHKLPKPAWCRFFYITLCGVARFWFQKTQEKILGIQQREDESLKEYVAQFSKETLHMADRFDVMVSKAFISGLRPWPLVRDLIAKPSTSLEDLFTHTHNFIRANEANNGNRLRETRRETKQHMTYRDLPRRQKQKHISRLVGRHMESHRVQHDTFTPLIKSLAEILATSKERAMLQRPPKMFAPANKRDQTKYYEFLKDHGHDTNDCIDLQKEIEACIQKGWMEKNADIKKSRFPFPNITFSKDDPIPEHYTGEDPLIISADVGTTQIHRIYIDGCSSVEIMYEHYFEQLTLEKRNKATKSSTHRIRWSIISWPLGFITLSFTLYDYRDQVCMMVMIKFMIVRARSPYNIILGHPGLMQFGAVASTLHALMKFQMEKGISVVRGERFQLNICNHIFKKRDRPEEANSTEYIDHIVINNAYIDQMLVIAANLPKMLKKQLHERLCSNKDVFAWTLADMTGIPQELAEHKLNIHPRTFLVWQKTGHSSGTKRSNYGGSIQASRSTNPQSSYFRRRVSILVMVKRIDETWRMCIDFINLNKAFPKDSYPLLEIDQKLES
uniref:Reverse transcriptase domain-containing protein n=1 Tax=Tanacetum cinerariifolium TaxID=118510 RepID=A0A6L2K6J2_TANCI|nr:hypothetical protein [Tanacetum cinerariifolium]